MIIIINIFHDHYYHQHYHHQYYYYHHNIIIIIIIVKEYPELNKTLLFTLKDLLEELSADGIKKYAVSS
jgi:hypothetical protein